MVKRSAAVLLSALLCGCPDDIGGGAGGVVVTGLRAPTDLKGIPNGGSEIVLTWKDRATDETGYRVEMNFSPFGTPFIGGVEFLPENATTLVFPSFPNITYYFRVFAISAVMESDPSEVIVVSTPDVPERPTSFSGSPESTTQIVARWSDVGNETGYRLEVSSDDGATWRTGFTLGPNLSQGPVPGLLSDAEYLIRVIAFNGHGDSTPSSPVRTSTLSAQVSFEVASDSDTGTFNSYIITFGGHEYLAHFDSASQTVQYTTKNPGKSYATSTVDAGPTGLDSVGVDGTSIAADGFGRILIAAHDQTLDRLRFITNESGTWIGSTLGNFASGLGGAKPRLFWDHPSGRVHIYYHTVWMGKPNIGHACRTSPTTWLFPEPFSIEADPTATFSACIDPSGTRHLAIVSAQRELWYVEDPGAPEIIHPPPGVRVPLPTTSIAPDFTAIAASGGAVHVVFHDRNSGGLYHATRASGAWVTEKVDFLAGQDLGRYCAAALHPSTGRLHVAYYDGSNRDLKYARKDPGGNWVRKVLDAAGDVGSHASVALDPAGKIHIAYRDETNKRLKIATGTP